MFSVAWACTFLLLVALGRRCACVRLCRLPRRAFLTAGEAKIRFVDAARAGTASRDGKGTLLALAWSLLPSDPQAVCSFCSKS